MPTQPHILIAFQQRRRKWVMQNQLQKNFLHTKTDLEVRQRSRNQVQMILPENGIDGLLRIKSLKPTEYIDESGTSEESEFSQLSEKKLKRLEQQGGKVLVEKYKANKATRSIIRRTQMTDVDKQRCKDIRQKYDNENTEKGRRKRG